MIDFHMAATFVIIAAAVILYVVERIELEITAVCVVVVFLLLFQLYPLTDDAGTRLVTVDMLLAGFANPALVTIMALLVVGQGMYQTGALDGVTRLATSMGDRRPRTTIIVVLLLAASLSAFMNNTPQVVMMLPVLSAIAAKMRMSPSKVMMPLSFITILGGMTTLIGSSTNLLVAGVAHDAGLPAIGFFDFFGIALVLAVVGAVYVIAIMPRLLRSRATMVQEVGGGQGRQFVAEIRVGSGHPLAGARSEVGLFPQLKGMTVLLIQRGSKRLLPPFDEVEITPGDCVIVAATRTVLTNALTSRAGLLTAEGNPPEVTGEQASQPAATRHLHLAEAVVAPGSRMIGRTIEASAIQVTTGSVVLGIQRQSRMLRTAMRDIRLESGDVLLVAGTEEQIEGLRADKDVILMEWSTAPVPATDRATPALVIFAGMVGAAALGIVPIVVAALTGGLLMLLAGCLNVRQAARAFDRRVYLLIGSSLAMAVPLQATGGAAFLAHGVIDAVGHLGPAVVLSSVFLLIAILTNFLSNNATAVLITPIAITAAAELGIDPMIMVFTVILAANCSFATPIGYQTNLLVMGPGHYRFIDYAIAGTPLVILLWLTYSVVAPFWYGL
ncbi:MAG: SLC13 family permease [Pseudomonadota bacterium]